MSLRAPAAHWTKRRSTPLAISNGSNSILNPLSIRLLTCLLYMNSQPRCLVVIFRDALTLGLSQQDSTRVLNVGQRTYVDKIDKFWYGFYDWLRDPQGRVL